MMNVWLIALGGALGSVCRHWIGLWQPASWNFPAGTLAVNLLGAFFIGLVVGVSENWAVMHKISTKEFWIIGFCGGFTTFSAFSLQTLNLMEEHRWMMAAGNVVASVAGCLLATYVGVKLGARIS